MLNNLLCLNVWWKEVLFSVMVVSKPYLDYIHAVVVFKTCLPLLVLEFVTSERAVNLISLHFFACLCQPSDLRKHRRKVKCLVV